MGVTLAAMWPNGSNDDCRFAFGGIELLRNADGNGLTLKKVAVYTLDAGHASPYLAKTDAVTAANAYAFAEPAMSASLLVFTAR